MDDERARDGLTHLQGAAVELISAARAFLDVAEDLVRDPGTATALASAVSSLAEVARAATRPTPTGDEPRAHVEHIRVS